MRYFFKIHLAGLFFLSDKLGLVHKDAFFIRTGTKLQACFLSFMRLQFV